MATMTSVYAEKTPPAPQPVPVTITLPDMTAFWASCKEYILGPVVNNIVEKRVQEMSIGALSKTLENKVNIVMADFIKEGNVAKELSSNNGSKEEIKCHHILMAELFHSVRPAESTVRGMYPKMIKLFDQLNKLYPDQYTQLDYQIDENMFMATEKEVSKVFTEVKEPVTVKLDEIVKPEQTQQEDEADQVEADGFEDDDLVA